MDGDSVGEIYQLDGTGHRSIFKWGRSAEEIEMARSIFNEYKEKKWGLFRLGPFDRQGEKMDEFDPEARGILAIPRLQGG